MLSFIAAASLSYTADGMSMVVPDGVVDTDLMIMGITSANIAAMPVLAGASEIVPPVDSGTQQALVLSASGHEAGDSLLISGSSLVPSAVVAAWYRDAAVWGLSEVWVKTNSRTTINAQWVPGTNPNPNISVCLFLEKSGSNTVLTPPEVSGVTRRTFSPWVSSATGMPSAWLGDYSAAPTVIKTITYPQSSANGFGLQVLLEETLDMAPSLPQVLGVWDGSSLLPAAVLGSWDGSSLLTTQFKNQ